LNLRDRSSEEQGNQRHVNLTKATARYRWPDSTNQERSTITGSLSTKETRQRKTITLSAFGLQDVISNEDDNTNTTAQAMINVCAQVQSVAILNTSIA
jgi:hypothetical protein